MSTHEVSKREVQAFWSRNPPGIEAKEKAPVGSREFYKSVDEDRYLSENYILEIILQAEARGKRVLEIGSGLGSDSRLFSKRGAKVVSIDLSVSNAKLTHTGFKALDLSGEAVAADAENLPFREEVFDCVYSFGVLHHTPDTRGAINQMRKVLKPRGLAIVMLYNKGLSYSLIWLIYGMLSLGFFRMPKECVFSKRYDHTPLSKMYSEKEVKALFTRFHSIKKTKVVNFGGIRNHPYLRYLWRLYKVFPWLEKRLGSFRVIFAEK